MAHKDITGSLYPGRSLPLAWLAAIVCLNILLRIPQLGHMLAWDEAWNLVALQSVRGPDPTFINRYWVHPPLYMWIGQLLAPMRAGLEYRVEIFNLALGSGALLVFIRLVAGLFGKPTALYTGIAYALMPGAVFFDTWIKRDPLVTLFCILALWAYLRRRDRLCGVLLGLGLLAKENAVFYCGTVFLLAAFLRSGRRSWQSLFVICAAAFLVSAWGYVWMLAKTGVGLENFRYFTGETIFTQGFDRPWWYYFGKLKTDLGLAGLLLLGVGLFALLPRGRPAFAVLGRRLAQSRMLPIYMLLPGYAVLAVSIGKPSWMTIVLQPGLALLMGLGWTCFVKMLRSFAGARISGRSAAILAPALLTAILAVQLAGFSYNQYFKEISPNQFLVSEISLEITGLVKDLVKDDERLLIMPMLYRNNPDYPDPIVYWRLAGTKQIDTRQILRSPKPELTYQAFRELIIHKKVHWVLMAPAAGNSQEELARRLRSEIPPLGRAFSRGILARVDALWNKGSL